MARFGSGCCTVEGTPPEAFEAAGRPGALSAAVSWGAAAGFSAGLATCTLSACFLTSGAGCWLLNR